MDKKRILIVEDQTDNRELMALVLRRLGYNVTEAVTGLDAINQARAARPDLIFMDLALPGISGAEATERLKADSATRDIPVIVNTAFHNGSALVERALAVGAAEIMYKPINFKALEEVAHRYLSSQNPSDTNGNPPPFEFSTTT